MTSWRHLVWNVENGCRLAESFSGGRNRLDKRYRLIQAIAFDILINTNIFNTYRCSEAIDCNNADNLPVAMQLRVIPGLKEYLAKQSIIANFSKQWVTNDRLVHWWKFSWIYPALLREGKGNLGILGVLRNAGSNIKWLLL